MLSKEDILQRMRLVRALLVELKLDVQQYADGDLATAVVATAPILYLDWFNDTHMRAVSDWLGKNCQPE